MSIAEKILERCSRPGGSDRASLVALFGHLQRKTARQCIDDMVASGDVLRFTRRPANGKGRDAQQYFTDAADGQRWASEQNVEPRAASVRKALRKAAPKPVPLTISKKRERVTVLAADADADADVIVPAGLKVQVIPGMPAVDPRYQVDPNTRVVGGFASLGPGRYLEDTRP